MTEKENEDEVNYFEDEEDDGEPDCYGCTCCGYSCVKRPAFGGQCPKCGAIMEEEYL